MAEIDPKLQAVVDDIARDCGLEEDQVVNLAIYELARRLGHIQSTPRRVSEPPGADMLADNEEAPASQPVRRSGRAPVPGRHPGRSPRQAPQRKKPPSEILYMQVDQGPMVPIRKDVFLIGRGSKCDQVIQHRSISREHAVITRERQGWFIEDLNSSNGTWLNGEQISKQKISGGEEIQISNYRLRFTFRAN